MLGAEPTALADAGDLALLRAVGTEAAAIALRHFQRGTRHWTKANGTPVSDADIEVGRFLAARLLAARPDYGWLSEEDDDDLQRLDRRALFVVDPIDGTREFLAGRKEWTISVAAVRDRRPVAAFLAAPALGETAWAADGEGAFADGRRLFASNATEFAGARLAGPRTAMRGLAERAGVPASAIRFVGSLAYRLALVSLDRAEVAVGNQGSREWDLAAADLLVHEAGGSLADLAGNRIRYNARDTAQPVVVAAAPRLAAEAQRLIGAALADSMGDAGASSG